MKRKLLNLLMVLILLVSIPGSLILASDISGALYKMSIVVSNNGTLANYVSTNGVISTPNLIVGGFLNASANNCAVLDAADNDVPFMPGYTTNPWCFWVETIGASAYLNYDLYTADTTGGSIAYFPGLTGMIVADNGTLELGSDFEVNAVGWVDTVTSANKSLVFKDEAYETYISADNEITSTITYGGGFPIVEANNGGNDVVNQLNHTVNLPAGIVTGNLLLVLFAADGNPLITFPNEGTDWIQLFEDGRAPDVKVAVAYRIADGSEGATITVATDANEMTAHTTYRISNYSGTPEVGAKTDGNTNIPDPPNLTPSWGAFDTLWFAFEGNDDQVTVNADPANYGDGRNDVAANAEGCAVGTARRELNAAAENPGVFTLSGADEWVANTIAIAPADLEVTATGIASGEYTVTTSLNSQSFTAADYDTYTTIGVSMGGGMIPVVLLDEEELAAPAASVTFSGIDTLVADWDTYAGVTSRHLVVLTNVRGTAVATTQLLRIRFNGDSGNNYNRQRLEGTAAAPTASADTGAAYLDIAYIPGTSGTYPNSYGGGTLLIPHAFNATNHKSVLSQYGAMEVTVGVRAGRWASVDAIASILLFLETENFETDSTLWLGVVDERYLVEEDLLAAPGTVDFAAIPQDGSDLAIIGYPRGTVAGQEDELEIEFNADGGGATSFTQRLLGTAAVRSAATANDNLVGWMPTLNATANAFGVFVGFINQYAETTNDPHYLTLNGYHETVGPTSRVGAYSGRWNNVAAVTQVEFYGNGAANLATGSLFSLYRVPRTLIDRQELAVAAATITFATIPQGYEILQLNIYTQSDDVGATDTVLVSYNTDVVAANYDTQYVEGTGAAAPTAARNAADRSLMRVPAAGAGANIWGGGIVTMPDYAKADRHKHHINISGACEAEVYLWSSRWESLNPITDIDLTLTSAANFDIGTVVELVGIFPQDVMAIEIDGDLYGIEDGNNASVPDNNNDWEFFLNDAMPYVYSANVSVSGVPVSAWEWEYDTIFYDSIGVNDATPSFRTASSDVDVVATAISFQPIEEAKAPPWTLDTTTATWITAANVTGNFTTAPTPTYPGADVIEDISAATGTPAQLPFIIIFGFITLAISFAVSYVLRQHGSRSLVVKIIIIGGLLGIGEAVRIIDFWMLLFFLIIAFAIMVASKPGEAI